MTRIGHPLHGPGESGYRGVMEKAKLGAGSDYSRTFEEMDEWFPSEAGCRLLVGDDLPRATVMRAALDVVADDLRRR